MRQTIVRLSVVCMVLCAVPALSLAAGGTLPMDAKMVTIQTSAATVWLPVISFFGLVGLVVVLLGGFGHGVMAKVAGVVFALSLAGAGWPWITSFFGVAQGLVL